MAKLWENTEALDTVLKTLKNKAAGTGELRLDFNNSTASAISGYTFTGCEELGMVAFPKCVYIGSHAFDNCSNLSAATFAEGKVSEYAFNNCTNLQEFTMLSAHYGTSGYLAANAFEGCTNLKRINLYPDNMVTLEDVHAFPHGNIEFWVSGKAIGNYQSDITWGRLGTSMQVLPETISEEEEPVILE